MNHPEALLDRALRGTLSTDDRPVLREHVRECPECALALHAARDFAAEAAPRAGDEDKLARLVAGAMERLEGEASVAQLPHQGTGPRVGLVSAPTPIVPFARGPSRPSRRWAVLAVLAATFVVVGAVAAVTVPTLLRAPAAAPSTPMPPPSEVPSAREEPAAPPATTPAPSSAPAPPSEPPVVPTASAPRPESAAALFTRANEARRRGDAGECVRLYRQLQRTYPGSSEAHQSHLGLGRLLLDRQGDAAGALREFDLYLAGGGGLREEALVGRALALGRLGRRAEERAAWQAILDGNPRSIHAPRAKERIEQLR